MVAYFFQHLSLSTDYEFMTKEVKTGLHNASWCILQYSFLPKFLHQSWDGIGRTG